MTIKQKRERIKFILSQLSEGNCDIFMKMYSPDQSRDINAVVDQLSPKQLDWALTQCKNTYYKILNIIKGS